MNLRLTSPAQPYSKLSARERQFPPLMWTDGGGKGSVRYFRNKLIISQTRLGYMLMKKAGVLDGFKQIK